MATTTFLADLIVRPKQGVRDPQASAVEDSLQSLKMDDVKCEVVCVGRMLRLQVQATSETHARSVVDEMCARLLVNPNLETYELKVAEIQ